MSTQNRTDRTANRMRSWLKSIARKRVSRSVTADDANRYLDRVGVSRDSRVRLSYINSVLYPTNRNFTFAGRTRSTRPVAKSRTITRWMVR